MWAAFLLLQPPEEELVWATLYTVQWVGPLVPSSGVGPPQRESGKKKKLSSDTQSALIFTDFTLIFGFFCEILDNLTSSGLEMLFKQKRREVQRLICFWWKSHRQGNFIWIASFNNKAVQSVLHKTQKALRENLKQALLLVFMAQTRRSCQWCEKQVQPPLSYFPAEHCQDRCGLFCTVWDRVNTPLNIPKKKKGKKEQC